MYGIDPRALIAMRVCLSVVILVDVWCRTGVGNNFLELHAFYGPNGLWPRSLAQASLAKSAFVLHYGTDTIFGYQFLFALEALAAMAMLVGYNTRFATFIAWVLATGMQRRNICINCSGDTIHRLMLLWMLFLPESSFTLDSGTLNLAHLRALNKSRPKQILSFATMTMVLQVGFVYLGSTFHKSYISYVENADAVQMVIQFEHYTSTNIVAATMLKYPAALQVLCRITFFVEVICGSLVLFPIFFPAKVRLFCVVVLSGLQFGFMSSIYLGIFPWTCITLHMGCLPTSAWDFLFGAPISAPENTEALATEEEDKAPSRFIPQRRSVVSEVTVFVLLILAVLSNLHTMQAPGTEAFLTNPYRGKMVPQGVIDVQEMLGFKQLWNMFPFRTTEHSISGRHIVGGKLTDGTKLNLQTLKEWEKPSMKRLPFHEDIKVLPSRLWRAYWVYVWGVNRPSMLRQAARFMCHKYNDLGYRLNSTSADLKEVKLWRVAYLVDRTQPYPDDAPTKEYPHIERQLTHECDSEE